MRNVKTERKTEVLRDTDVKRSFIKSTRERHMQFVRCINRGAIEKLALCGRMLGKKGEESYM